MIGEKKIRRVDMNILILIACLSLAIFGVRYLSSQFVEGTPEGVKTAAITDESTLPVEKIDTREEAIVKLQKVVSSIRGATAVVLDMNSGEVLAQKKSNEIRSLASLTKVVTATLIYEAYKSPSSRATVLPKIQHMLTTSSNEEAQALAHSFSNSEGEAATAMTRYAKPYGLTFRNVSGLDTSIYSSTTDEFGSTTVTESREPSNQGSALGFARFAADSYVKYPEFFDTTIRPRDNTNIITNQLNFMLGGKTGFTDLAGGNLMVIVQKGISHPYVIVVLGSTEKGRFVDVENIASALVQLNI